MQALNNNKLAWSLVEQAVAAGASDLHLEPMRDAVRVRIRVDGLLRELVRLPLAAHSTLVTQLKVAANMDIAEKRVPQDGRIALELDGRSVDLRLSTLPTTLGEKIAIRLLAQQELLQLAGEQDRPGLGLAAQGSSQLWNGDPIHVVGDERLAIQRRLRTDGDGIGLHILSADIDRVPHGQPQALPLAQGIAHGPPMGAHGLAILV